MKSLKSIKGVAPFGGIEYCLGGLPVESINDNTSIIFLRHALAFHIKAASICCMTSLTPKNIVPEFLAKPQYSV